MTALVLGAIVAVAAVVLVSLPFVLAGDDAIDAPDDAAERRLELIDTSGEELLALMETRDRALAALKELEFDHRTGAVTDEDYRDLVGPLRRAAAEAIQALDAQE